MRDLAANSPPDFHLGSSLSGRASKARYYRSARGFKDLIKCDNKVYINSDAATLTTGCRQQCGAGSDMLGGSGEGKLTLVSKVQPYPGGGILPLPPTPLKQAGFKTTN